jgi:hypothetical protein
MPKMKSLKRGENHTRTASVWTTDGFRTSLPDGTDSLLYIYRASAYTVDRVLTPDEKDSSSTSIVFFGTHRETGQSIAGKVFIDYVKQALPTQDLEDLLEDLIQDFTMMSYEACVYEALTQTRNPHIVRWVSTQYIARPSFDTPEVVKLLDELKLSLIIPPELAHLVQGCRIILTERRDHVLPLHLFFHSPPKILKNILFQLIFTLLLLHQDGFQHNDLHAKNVLIDVQPEVDAVEYHYDTLTFALDVSAGKALVFDWDFGVSQQCGRNVELDNTFCAVSGQCNDLNPRLDFYKLLRGFRIPGDKDFTRFQRDMGVTGRPIISKQQFTLGHKSIVQSAPGNMCNYDGQHCAPFPPGEPSFLKTPIDAIRHSYFKEFQST